MSSVADLSLDSVDFDASAACEGERTLVGILFLLQLQI